mgnify:CR=1 FL=1
MNKFVKSMTLIGIFVVGVFVGTHVKTNDKIEVKEIVTESREGLYLECSEKYVELTDGSFIIYGNGNYIFQPVDLGDWNYELESEEDLRNIVLTYKSMKENGNF